MQPSTFFDLQRCLRFNSKATAALKLYLPVTQAVPWLYKVWLDFMTYQQWMIYHKY